MGKMKKLLIEIFEYEEEIINLLTQTKRVIPTAFALFFDDDLPSHTIADFLRRFTKDEELIKFTIAAIEFNIVDFGNPLENTVLSLAMPK